MNAGKQPILTELSTAQLGIWVAQMLNPQSPIFNITEYVEILGPVDARCFEAALRLIVAETDSLHLRFVETDDGPRQYLAHDPNWVLPFIDVEAEADPRAAAEAWMRNDMVRAIDLARDPPFGFALIRAAPDRFYWYVRYHHLVNDGIGGTLVAQRLAALYSALAEARPPKTEATGSWYELLDDEEQYRRSARYERDRNYWRDQLPSRPDPVTLSRKRPARSDGFIRSTDRVQPSVARALQTLATTCNASLPQVITAAAALYLYRLTGVRDLTLGMPVTARTGARMRHIVGMVSNVLPLRLLLEPQDGFADLLRAVSRRMREVLRHQRYRAEDLRRDVGLRADEPDVYGTLVNVMPFDYDLRFAGHQTHTHNLSNGPVDDLSIVAYDHHDGSGLRIDLDANPAHYSADALAVHQRRFLALLAQVAAAGPDVRPHQLDILTPEERHTVLEGFNSNARELPGATLPELFESRVARDPEGLALLSGAQAISYGDLNTRVNRLAHYLIGLGAGPERLVGVALERSVDLVVALLATLKAGAAYLPLDPNYPAARLEQMLADATPTIVLSTRALCGCLPPTRTVLCLDAPDTEAVLARTPAHNPTQAERTIPLLPRHQAYVIYTSGSTGDPKGVVIEQQALINKVCTLNEYLGVATTTRYAATTSIGFDPLLEQILCPLCAGATSVIVADEIRDDARRFTAYAEQHRLSVLNGTPRLIAALLRDGKHADPSRRPSHRRRRSVCRAGEHASSGGRRAADPQSLWTDRGLHRCLGP